MNKVYLLLRNNKQSGPFSLDELLKQELKPTDLIWVEGKSVGWMYPSELEEIQTYFINTTQGTEKLPGSQPLKNAPKASKPEATQNKNVFVSAPGKTSLSTQKKDISPEDFIEQKAAELRERALSAASKNVKLPKEEIVQTHYARSLPEVEEDYTNWVFIKKTKRKKTFSTNQVMAGVIIFSIALFTGGKMFFFNKTETGTIPDSYSKQTLLPDEMGKSSMPVKTASEKPMTTEETQTENKKENKRTVSIKESSNPVILQKPASGKEDNKTKQGPVVSSTSKSNDTDENSSVSTAEVKKKTLSEKVSDFFGNLKNKKKAEGDPEDAPKPVSTDNETAERQAAHRNETSSKVASTEVMNQIRVSANNNSDNWMMGVHGLKLTLRNNSNELITTATIEVFYYNENNELMEKKPVTFSNIPAKGSATLPAPDHRLADHFSYELGAVSIKVE